MNKLILVIAAAAVAVAAWVHHFKFQKGPQAPLNNQMVSFLQEYIRINTSHPAPAYSQAIAFLKRQAHKDGFITQEVALPCGNHVLIISYPGINRNLPALALNHHMDVVPATPQGWIKPPFAGEIYNGILIGRGTQDMKGIGATHYFALKELKQQRIVPQRSIYLFAVPDEEVGGFKGTKEFIETQEFKSLNIGFIVDEGHASGKSDVLDIKVAERKPIQIVLTARGAEAHGSHLECANAIHDLVKFLNQIIQVHEGQQSQCVHTHAGKLLSCNITSLGAGIKKENGHIALNMVPDVAQATIDIRVPPTLKKAQVLKMLDSLLLEYPMITYTIAAQADEEPELGDYRTPLYTAIESAIGSVGLRAQPHYFEASSDLRFYQARGIHGIGLTPFCIEDNIHGINESVPIEELIRGKDITLQFLKNFCC